MDLQFGPEAILAYRRLNYTLWYALAEFVDNALQSYLDHQSELDKALNDAGEDFEISVAYDPNEGIRITDNAHGMTLSDLERALTVGQAPPNRGGLSEYGMGMKTGACWLGRILEIRTKPFRQTDEYSLAVDFDKAASGDVHLDVKTNGGRPAEDHYTVIQITGLHQGFGGRTLGKVGAWLPSMYRRFLTDGRMRLTWRDSVLEWPDDPDRFYAAKNGDRYFKRFSFEVNGKPVTGWVGVRSKGKRADAGFAIVRRDRVITGWPETWRPESIFGRNSNDLVNQRIEGEIDLDAFGVSFTKNGILWEADEEADVEAKLAEVVAEYSAFAKTWRPTREEGADSGPSDLEVQTAVEEFNEELTSPAVVNTVEITEVPPPEVVEKKFEVLIDQVSGNGKAPDFGGAIASGLRIDGYLSRDLSMNDPYVATQAPSGDAIVVVVNLNHPYVNEIDGERGFLNYLRYCTYDAIAEWQGSRLQGGVTSNMLKGLKDNLLRVPLQIEMQPAASDS